VKDASRQFMGGLDDIAGIGDIEAFAGKSFIAASSVPLA
jgi:hypothetical protein